MLIINCYKSAYGSVGGAAEYISLGACILTYLFNKLSFKLALICNGEAQSYAGLFDLCGYIVYEIFKEIGISGELDGNQLTARVTVINLNEISSAVSFRFFYALSDKICDLYVICTDTCRIGALNNLLGFILKLCKSLFIIRFFFAYIYKNRGQIGNNAYFRLSFDSYRSVKIHSAFLSLFTCNSLVHPIKRKLRAAVK